MISQKIHLYTICWNEIDMLPHFFKYYDKIVDRYVVFDDGSNDGSIELLKKHPKVEIRKLERKGNDSYILAAQNIHENCWKESINKADWVIITAIDEFLHRPFLYWYLLWCKMKKTTAIPALGYQMISNNCPKSNKLIFKQIKSGCAFSKMNKLSIFNPNKITATNQKPGRHMATPQGEVTYPKRDTLKNLHFKYINFETTFKRNCELNKKLGNTDKENQWGHQYAWQKNELQEQWNHFMSLSVPNIFNIPYESLKEHTPTPERWWNNKLNFI